MSGEKPLFQPQVNTGHEGLAQALKQMGLHYEETSGKYKEPERSYIIHGATLDQMKQLGKMFGQESVVHSQNGQHRLVYTNGENEGKFHPAQMQTPVEHFEQPPQDFYTAVPGHGYMRINFDWNQTQDMEHGHKKSEREFDLETAGHLAKNAVAQLLQAQAPVKAHPHAYDWHDGHTDHHQEELAGPQLPGLAKAGEAHPHMDGPPAPAAAAAPQPDYNDQNAKAGVSTYKKFALPFGNVQPGQPSDLLHYKYHGKLPEITKLVQDHGFKVYYAGGKYGKPDLANKNYNTGHLMVFDPSSANEFGHQEYTNGWRQIHELSHALVYPELNKIYGEGRRLGKLGVHRTLNEALRAVHWEWLAAHKQRELSRQIGVNLTDQEFNKELNTVMHDAAHRAVTGKFTEPSGEGFIPHGHHVPLHVSLQMVRDAAHEMGLKGMHETIKKSELAKAFPNKSTARTAPIISNSQGPNGPNRDMRADCWKCGRSHRVARTEDIRTDGKSVYKCPECVAKDKRGGGPGQIQGKPASPEPAPPTRLEMIRAAAARRQRDQSLKDMIGDEPTEKSMQKNLPLKSPAAAGVTRAPGLHNDLKSLHGALKAAGPVGSPAHTQLLAAHANHAPLLQDLGKYGQTGSKIISAMNAAANSKANAGVGVGAKVTVKAEDLDMEKVEPLMKPPVSEAQRRAMGAAASGNSTLGIPKKVGKEFIDADKGGKLPEVKKGEAHAFVSDGIVGQTDGKCRDCKEPISHSNHRDTSNSKEKARIENQLRGTGLGRLAGLDKSEPNLSKAEGDHPVAEKTYTPEEANEILLKATQEKLATFAKEIQALRERELKKAIVPPHKHNQGSQASMAAEDIPPGKLNPKGVDKSKVEKNALMGYGSPASTSAAPGPGPSLAMAEQDGEMCKACKSVKKMCKCMGKTAPDGTKIPPPTGGAEGEWRDAQEAKAKEVKKADLVSENGKRTENHSVAGAKDPKATKEIERGSKKDPGSGGIKLPGSKLKKGSINPSKEDIGPSDSEPEPQATRCKKCGSYSSAPRDEKGLCADCAEPVKKNAAPPMAKPPSGKNMGTAVPTSAPKPPAMKAELQKDIGNFAKPQPQFASQQGHPSQPAGAGYGASGHQITQPIPKRKVGAGNAGSIGSMTPSDMLTQQDTVSRVKTPVMPGSGGRRPANTVSLPGAHLKRPEATVSMKSDTMDKAVDKIVVHGDKPSQPPKGADYTSSKQGDKAVYEAKKPDLEKAALPNQNASAMAGPVGRGGPDLIPSDPAPKPAAKPQYVHPNHAALAAGAKPLTPAQPKLASPKAAGATRSAGPLAAKPAAPAAAPTAAKPAGAKPGIFGKLFGGK